MEKVGGVGRICKLAPDEISAAEAKTFLSTLLIRTAGKENVLYDPCAIQHIKHIYMVNI